MLIPLTVFILSACSKATQEQEVGESYHQSASLVTVEPEKSYTLVRRYLGQIAAKQHTSLSFEYSGRINTILVDSGDVVQKGQLLAQQDTQLLSYKTTELAAQKKQAQAQITLNKANLARIKSLLDNGYSALQRLDELTSENTILKAKINALDARINTLNYQKEKSSLIAPFEGVITKRFSSKGEMTTSSQPSFHLIEYANNEVSVGIPRKIASTLVLGQLITVTMDGSTAKDSTRQAKLIAIGQQVNIANRTVQLRLKMLKRLERTNQYDGQLVRIAIEQKITKPGFWLPINAITDGVRGQWQVLIASPTTNSSNNYQLQSATVKVLHANEHSAYVNGLPLEPQRIVAQGVHRYVSGQVIKVSAQSLANIKGNQK